MRAAISVSPDLARTAQAAALSATCRDALDDLRSIAMRLRGDPRDPSDEAAAYPTDMSAETTTAVAERLLKALPAATRGGVVFYRPGARETTFDEAWTLRLLTSIQRGERDNVRFALTARIRRDRRAVVLLLASELARRLDAAQSLLL